MKRTQDVRSEQGCYLQLHQVAKVERIGGKVEGAEKRSFVEIVESEGKSEI
jgi:hypothetical protein